MSEKPSALPALRVSTVVQILTVVVAAVWVVADLRVQRSTIANMQRDQTRLQAQLDRLSSLDILPGAAREIANLDREQADDRRVIDQIERDLQELSRELHSLKARTGGAQSSSVKGPPLKPGPN